MLRELHITDFTLIRQLSIDFAKGMTVLTGETGAGKSILIDALLLILGLRANPKLIRHGCQHCQISAVFSVQHNSAAQAWLDSNGLVQADEEDVCIIRRRLSTEGRSQAFINDQPVALTQLKHLSQYLLTIHGQHEQQRLLQKDFQRQLLDNYGQHQTLLNKCEQLTQQYSHTQQQLQQLQQAGLDASRADYLQFQLDELIQLDLQPDEIDQLHQQYKKLAHAEQLLQDTQASISLLEDDQQPAILSQLQHVQHHLQQVQQLDPHINSTQQMIDSAVIQLQEARHELQHYLTAIELDPQQLQHITARLEKIHDVARKHQIEPEQLLVLQDNLQQQLDALQHSASDIENLQQQLASLEQDYQQIAKRLTTARQKAAKTFAKAITASLQQLSMANARFAINISSRDSIQPHQHGQDQLVFELCSNQGQAQHPLADIASGGELSRVALAIDVLTANSQAIPCIIFDEIDTGIGGQTAAVIGELLRELGCNTQVFCVTHQAQVAANAHHHFLVKKRTEQKVTFTEIENLNRSGRIEELSRMISGNEINDHSRKHAESLLQAANKQQKAVIA